MERQHQCQCFPNSRCHCNNSPKLLHALSPRCPGLASPRTRLLQQRYCSHKHTLRQRCQRDCSYMTSQLNRPAHLLLNSAEVQHLQSRAPMNHIQPAQTQTLPHQEQSCVGFIVATRLFGKQPATRSRTGNPLALFALFASVCFTSYLPLDYSLCRTRACS